MKERNHNYGCAIIMCVMVLHHYELIPPYEFWDYVKLVLVATLIDVVGWVISWVISWVIPKVK